MNQQFSRLISLGCLVILITVPFISMYYLLNIDQFADIAKNSIVLPIKWQTVSEMQWYILWALTVVHVAIGLAGLYYLRRAFSNFGKGQFFNTRNSCDLRLFSILLFTQAIVNPLFFTVSSVLLSMNHPAGQKILSVSFGSDDVKVVALAMILWVMSDLLVSGSKLETENKQFI